MVSSVLPGAIVVWQKDSGALGHPGKVINVYSHFPTYNVCALTYKSQNYCKS